MLGEDAVNFKKALAKIAAGDTKIGFSKDPLTEAEVKLIKTLNDKVK